MLATHNLPRVLGETRDARRVLDVGGCYAPLNTATHVIDALPFEAAKTALAPGVPVRFSASTWTVADICTAPWPFPTGFFDFAFCSHVLEDVRDPIAVCRELTRVARAGYIETPSRLREIVHHKKGYLWRRVVGRPIRVGFGHHRWFVEYEDQRLIFTAKTLTASHSPNFFIQASELGRPLSEAESAVAVFWSGRIDASERLLIHPGEVEDDLRDFKRRALTEFRSARAIA